MSTNQAGPYFTPGEPRKSHRVRNGLLGCLTLTLGAGAAASIGLYALTSGGEPGLHVAPDGGAPTVKPLGTATPTAKPATKPPAIVDGVWLVGAEVKPGTYRSSGKDTCYWARLSTTDGEALDGIIANGIGPNQTVTVKASDVAFQSQLCGGWVRVR